jgi:hypothetical protein
MLLLLSFIHNNNDDGALITLCTRIFVCGEFVQPVEDSHASCGDGEPESGVPECDSPWPPVVAPPPRQSRSWSCVVDKSGFEEELLLLFLSV